MSKVKINEKVYADTKTIHIGDEKVSAEDKKIFDEKVGEQLKKLREDLEISRVELAERMGVSHQTICNYEMGKKGLSIYKFAILCQILGISVTFGTWEER